MTTYKTAIGGTTPYVNYKFRVKPTNQQGSGPWSAELGSLGPDADIQFNFNKAENGTIQDFGDGEYNGLEGTWRLHTYSPGQTVKILMGIRPFTILMHGKGGNGAPDRAGGGGGGASYEGQIEIDAGDYVFTDTNGTMSLAFPSGTLTTAGGNKGGCGGGGNCSNGAGGGTPAAVEGLTARAGGNGGSPPPCDSCNGGGGGGGFTSSITGVDQGFCGGGGAGGWGASLGKGGVNGGGRGGNHDAGGGGGVRGGGGGGGGTYRGGGGGGAGAFYLAYRTG